MGRAGGSRVYSDPMYSRFRTTRKGGTTLSLPLIILSLRSKILLFSQFATTN